MNAVEIIEKKRDGGVLSPEEISFLVKAYTAGQIPDYQMAAWCMAVYFRGMTGEETASLTEAMAASGKRADLSLVPGIVVDKHSTGGVGDTVTLAAAPIAAAAGVPIAKMSGRSLGFTGGTADKLSSIPGYVTDLPFSSFVRQVQTVGIAMAGQSGGLCPADALLYALRDATGTVESLPLIASSIMSKKMVSGAGALVLDVKCGGGALMKDRKTAGALMEMLRFLGDRAGLMTAALLTDMSAPLGMAIGNSLEVDEAAELLSGGGGRRLRALTVAIAGAMIRMGGKAGSYEEGKEKAAALLSSGAAMDRFIACVATQHGETGWIGKRPLTPASNTCTVYAGKSGFLEAAEPAALARIVMAMGGGRKKKDDAIQPYVGIRLWKEVGDAVRTGEPLLTAYAAEGDDAAAFAGEAAAALGIGPEKKEIPLVYETAGLD